MNEATLLNILKELGITSQRLEHPALTTIESYYEAGIVLLDQGIKNLFLRNRKGNRHYLVVMDEHKQADLEKIAGQIGEAKLSFASEDRLQKYMGIPAGCVTPFALLNDTEHHVKVLLDNAIKQDELVGFHPLVNTATEAISYQDFLKFLAHTGHEPQLISI